MNSRFSPCPRRRRGTLIPGSRLGPYEILKPANVKVRTDGTVKVLDFGLAKAYRKQRLQAIGEARIVLQSPAAEETAPAAPARSRFGWIVAAAMTLVTAALGWIAWRATRPVEHPLIRISADIGLRNNARLEPDTTLATAQPGTLFALSPDGTRLPSGVVDRDGQVRLAIRRLDQSQFVPIPGTENPVSPFFSPDGQWPRQRAAGT